jgi:DNA helicase TIP49 (TBP-interacting protein)
MFTLVQSTFCCSLIGSDMGIVIMNLREWGFHFRYCLQLLTPASILASLQGRGQIELEDVGEMNELFLDAKTSAEEMAAAT